jgi:hypothetical protein
MFAGILLFISCPIQLTALSSTSPQPFLFDIDDGENARAATTVPPVNVPATTVLVHSKQSRRRKGRSAQYSMFYSKLETNLSLVHIPRTGGTLIETNGQSKKNVSASSCIN